MNITFIITITDTYKLKCSIINDKEQEIFITLKNKQEEYIPCITFNNNTISLCQEEENRIEFMQQWIKNPEEFITYPVHFQNKDYSLLSEVLFSIIITEFKQIIERNYIINETVVQIPTNHCQCVERIKISLQTIGLNNLTIIPNLIDYDYGEQGDFLFELLEKKKTIDEYQRKIERAKEIDSALEEKLNQFDFDNQDLIDEDSIHQKIANKFSLEERTKLNICSLDNYCLFIASRYLETLEDHVNLVKVSKRMKNNMEKFHYNPISLNNDTLSWFPNVETLHIYKEGDQYLQGGRIQRYIDWFTKIPYYQLKEVKEKFKEMKIEFMRIVWTEEDNKIEIDKHSDRSHWCIIEDINIPEGVKEIEKESFDLFHSYYYSIKSISIPRSAKVIPKNIFEKLLNLTKITIPISKYHYIHGNKIFTFPHFEQYIYLPSSIKLINEKQVDQIKNMESVSNTSIGTTLNNETSSNYYSYAQLVSQTPNNHLDNKTKKFIMPSSLSIPTSVTSLNEKCFYNYCDLKELIIPNTVKTIPRYCIEKCSQLTYLLLPLNDNQFISGNKFFSNDKSQLKQEIILPSSIKIINNQKTFDLTSFTISSNITSLDEKCFEDCHKIKVLYIPDSVKLIPKHCLKQLYNLTNITIPLSETRINCGDKIFSLPDFEEIISLPNSIEIINGKEIEQLVTLIIPSMVSSLHENCFRNCYNLRHIIIPDSVKYIHKKLFLKIPKLTELTISSQYKLHGDRLFIENDGYLDIIELPKSLKRLNNEDIQIQSIESFIIPNNVTKLSDYCFANCNELTEIRGLEHVKEIGKGCFINCPKLDREQYPKVQKNIEKYFKELLSERNKLQMEYWIQMKCSDILFDSNVDDWSPKTSVFDERIMKKKELTFLIEDEDGEMFGYHLSTRIMDRYYERIETDLYSFHFNLQSQNNRLGVPMKFDIIDSKRGGYILYEKFDDDDYLIRLGNIVLFKENRKNDSYCIQDNQCFEYHGIKNALCGKVKDYKCDYFVPKRILVIQMN